MTGTNEDDPNAEVSPDSTVQDLDLTYIEPGATSQEWPVVQFREKKYDPRPQEDAARRRIAYILLVLLGIVVVWALVAITFYLPTSDEAKIEYVTDVLQIILGPIIALVSAATGFYFGSKP